MKRLRIRFRFALCLLFLTLQACTDPEQQLLNSLRSSDYKIATRLLAESKLDLQAIDKFGYTALHLSNNVEITKLLIKQGADVNAKGAGVDPGIKPIKNVDLGKLGTLDLNELKRGDDYSPLHTVENSAVAAVLIKNGAQVNALANYDVTPLHQAAGRANSHALVKLLLKSGANVNARTFYNTTPLHKAMFYANKDNGELAKLLLEHGADVNAQDNLGHSPLHKIRQGNVTLASYLVKKGADVTLKTNDGDSPICYAIADNRIDLMHFYIVRGNGILTKCSENRSLLEYAKDRAHKPTLEAIKKATLLIMKEFNKRK